MPELPEVEIVRIGLAETMDSHVIETVDVRRPDIRAPIPKNFASSLKNRKVREIARRGKYIIAHLEGGGGFGLHLGMSGRIHIIDKNPEYVPARHDHIIFEIKQGKRIVFNDPRRFGMAFLIDDKWEQSPPFNAMGPEPLEDGFNGSILADKLQNRKGPIKTALLDQNVVAGVGNIYACEALFLSGIHPLKPCNALARAETAKLAAAIKKVLNKAIKAGGSSLRDYRQTNGDLGYFQHQFSVYDREDEPCPKRGCACAKKGGVKRMTLAGRSTYYCPEQQKRNF